MVVQFLGSLLGSLVVDGVELSECLRTELGLPELNALDGRGEPDHIQQLRASAEYAADQVTYTEKLVITAATDQVSYQRMGSDGTKIKQEFVLPGQVAELLESLAETNDLQLVTGVEKIEEQPSYLTGEMTLTYARRAPQHFNSLVELPEQWWEFVTTLHAALPLMSDGQLLNAQVGQDQVLLTEGLMFCSVTFSENGRSYYYLSNDRTLQIGDWVLVPAGYDDHEVEVKIVDINYFPVDDPPRPVSQTKTIIGRIEQ